MITIFVLHNISLITTLFKENQLQHDNNFVIINNQTSHLNELRAQTTKIIKRRISNKTPQAHNRTMLPVLGFYICVIIRARILMTQKPKKMTFYI